MDIDRTTSGAHLGLPAITTACFLSAVSGMMFNTLPLFLGTAVDSLGLSEAQAGVLASSGIAGFLVSALIAIAWIRRLNWRRWCIGASLLAALCYGGLSFAASYPLFLLLLFVIGLCLALLLSVVICWFGEQVNPDRLYALKIFGDIGLGALLI